MLIRKAKPEDKKIITEILTRSFRDNLSVSFIVGEKRQNEIKIEALVDYAYEMCHAFGEIWITDDLRGCALLIHTERKKSNLTAIWLDLQLIWKCVGFSKIWKVLKREARVKSLQAKGHIAYLWFIGVDPAHQHQGVGTALLTHVIETCKAEDRLLILETSTLNNVPWYKSFGFEIYATLDVGYKLFFLKKDVNVLPA